MSDLDNIVLNKYGANCVGYWPLNGNTNDLKSGNALSGGTAGSYVNGPDGERAMLFNGTNQSISSASSIDLTGTNKVTLVMFWNPFVYDATNAEIILETSAVSDTTDGSFCFAAYGSIAGDPIRVSTTGNVGFNREFYNDTTSVWSTPKWHHMAFVFDYSQATAANEVLVYKNGVLVTPDSTTAASNNTGNFGDHTLFIGGRNNVSNFANHSVSKVALFNTALTANQIKELSVYMRQGYSILNWMSYFDDAEIKRGYRYGD